MRISDWSADVCSSDLPLAVHLPAFYAGAMGLGLATVGTIFFVARLFDVVIDPMLGILSDKIDTRWGRRRFWLGLSVPILMVSSYYRSEERRVGKECVSPRRYRWSQDH